MRLRVAIRAVLPCAIALAMPAAAWGVAAPDPASAVLVKDDFYLPYDLAAEPVGDQLPAVRVPAQARELAHALAAARDRRRPFKVAVIGSEVDLGGVPDYLDRPPQRYADFLYKEISPVIGRTDASLVVVTPRGVAVAGPQASGPAITAVAKVKPGADPSPAALAQAGVDGVRAVAAANGHPLPEASDDDGGGGGPWLLLGIAALVLLGGALVLRVRLSRPSA